MNEEPIIIQKQVEIPYSIEIISENAEFSQSENSLQIREGVSLTGQSLIIELR